MLQVKQIINTPIDSNCFVIYDKEKGNDCIIVDPGSEDNTRLYELLKSEGLNPQYIILTHEHFDHCWGVNQLVEKYHLPIVCSQLCAEAIKHEKRNCSVFYDNMDAFIIKSETICVESINNTLDYNGHKLVFFYTPGHTDASISFVVDKYLFTGDTLIKDEKTVTKLPTGSVEKLKETVTFLAKLKGRGLKVMSGHEEEFLLDDYDLAKMTREQVIIY